MYLHQPVHYVSANPEVGERGGNITAVNEDGTVSIAVLDADERECKIVRHDNCRHGDEFHLTEECPLGQKQSETTTAADTSNINVSSGS